MNVTRLFLDKPSGALLTHVKSARTEVTRTWQALHDNVAALAAGLRNLGIRPGDRILILASSRVEVIECILAASAVGAAAMPVASTAGRAMLLSVVRRMKPACCLVEGRPDPEVLQTLREISCRIVALEGLDDSRSGDSNLYRELIDGPARGLELVSVPDEHPALIIHSSGSSGVPKVVVMSHGALLCYFEHHDLIWRQYSDSSDSLHATTPMVTGLPLTHLAGISICLQGLMNGRAAYVMSFFLPRLYLQMIEKTRCAYTLLVPSLYRSLLKEPYLQRMDRSALRCCILGGEACSLELVERIEAAFGVPAVMAYSMTECLSGIGHSRRDIFERRVKRGSCGRQLFGELSLRGADGSVQEDFGELWVRNATVHRCYLDDEMNDARLVNGWFRTGDLFARDEEGNFFHRGRVDDMFICNGKNVYPLEMETILLEHEGVEEACAAPVTSPTKGTVPAVLVVASRPLTSRDVQDHFRRHAPIHTVPQFVMFTDALPLLGPGKTDRREAAKRLQAGYDAARASAGAEAF